MAYTKYAQIDIDHTKVSADESDFPIVVTGTYDGTGGEPDIRTTGNGGKVENTTSGGASGSVTIPADLVFSPNKDGSAPHDFEIEKYDATTGEIVAHIRIPSLSSSSDTTIYICYGDSSVTTSQENVVGVWDDANYKAVYNMASTYDSSNNNDGSANGGISVGSATGKIGDATTGDGSDDYIDIGLKDWGSDLGGNTTMSFWIKNSDSTVGIMVAGNGSPTSDYFELQLNRNTTGDIRWHYMDQSASNDIDVITNEDDVLSDGSWHKVDIVFTGGDAADVDFYIDADLQTMTVDDDEGPVFQNLGYNIYLFARNNGGTDDKHANCTLDQIVFQTTNRSSDYISTTYNNQSQADQGENSTFFSLIGSEVDVGVISAPMLSAGF